MRISVNKIKYLIDKNIDFLQSTYSVKTIGVFGSVARQQHTFSSDIDLIVEFKEPIGFFKFLNLERYLSKILGREVDLVTKNALKPAIKDDVLKKVVYV